MAHLEERRIKAELEVQQLEDLINAKQDEAETLTERLKIDEVLKKKVNDDYQEAKKKREEQKKIEEE
jgi:hypothetical protein